MPQLLRRLFRSSGPGVPTGDADEPVPADFSETAYLAANPDVASAVASGAVASGAAHFRQHGRREGRPLAPAPPPPLMRFETRAPSAQTAVDLFRGRWASDLGPVLGVTGTGDAPLFADDAWLRQAAAALGRGDGRLDGMAVLEIGPLEAAHTAALERLGAASVVAVEQSGEAYLKCLLVKELLGLRARFLCGDAARFLEEAPHRRFDLVLCSGVLYHQADPLRLIRLICAATDRCYVWSHYYSPARHPPVPFRAVQAERDGFAATYWTHTYGDRSHRHWGGNAPDAAWLERDALLAAFAHFGLGEVALLEDAPDERNGPAITVAVQRGATAGEARRA